MFTCLDFCDLCFSEFDFRFFVCSVYEPSKFELSCLNRFQFLQFVNSSKFNSSISELIGFMRF